MDFPEHFRSVYPHMFLIKKNNNTYSMWPPNQRDWVFFLKRVSTDVWEVYGEKDDNETYYDRFLYSSNKWISYTEANYLRDRIIKTDL